MRIRVTLAVLCCFLFTCTFLEAFQPQDKKSGLAGKEFFNPTLSISSSNMELSSLLTQLPNQQAWQSFSSLHRDFTIFVDPRTGKPTNIIGSFSLIPGNGVNNDISMADVSLRLGKTVSTVDADMIGKLIVNFLSNYQGIFTVDLSQLGTVQTSQVADELWQVSIPQQFQGIPVRDARIVATLNHGNLIVIGTQTWADVAISTKPAISGDRAIALGYAYIGGRSPQDRFWKDPELQIIPYAPAEYQAGESFAGPIGRGIQHRLVWTFGFIRDPEPPRWEMIVDAQTGEVLAFQDTNQYINQKIVGAVYPLTSTEACPSAEFCGVMQQVFPMPWANTGIAAPNNYTSGSGVFDYTSGTVTTTLNGKYIRISDTCGALSKSANGSMNLGGANGEHDCITPGTGGPGNTASSRSAFYELNRIAEQARGWLPTNIWLNSQLTANVNIVQTCNAYYDYVTVNFFRSGGGCRNTGEIAAVFDHEWGHGLDDNDAAGLLSNSSEAYADIAAIYRYQASCVGYGFFWTYNTGCPQTADGTGNNANEAQLGAPHCDTNCSGVRDADWARHSNNTPDTPQNFVCGSCQASTGPCGRQVHCAAAPVRQAAWDLVTRDLTAPPFQYDSNTAFLIGNKLFYQGSGNVGLWHACDCTAQTSNGCAADNGYMQWLAADDDNGNLNDGTPHMTAIYAAFNRHNIACATPTPTNTGCAAGPSTAPVVTANASDGEIGLSWNAVAGATKYWVLRTDGHAGCDYGKVNLTPAGTTQLSYADTGLLNGRTYYYNVVAVGNSNSCFSPASECASAAAVSTCTLPPAPENLTPADGSTNISVTAAVDWTDIADALSYDIEIATDPAFTNMVRSSNVENSTWTVTPQLDYGTTYYWRARAINACDSGPYSAPFSFTTIPPPPGVAVYDSILKAPKCAIVSEFCDSTTLLNGRDGKGPEPNQPNTINNSCADGTGGTYHLDESNDRIKVSTLDGTPMAEGKSVKIEATVWVYSIASNFLDLYYAQNANSPTWNFLGTQIPTGTGVQTLSTNYVLPAGNLQAVRARFRYGGSATACFAGAYDDHDDLIFAVGSGCPTPIAPILQTPANSSTNVLVTPVLDWTDVSGASSYDVQVATDAAFANVVRSASGLTSSTWTVSPALNFATVYYWRVRANNDCGGGSYSTPFSFTTPVTDFSLSCTPSAISVPIGQARTSTCTITTIGGFTGAVNLSCSGLRTKTSCSFSPNPVTPPGSTTSTLTLTVAKGAKTGSYSFQVNGSSGTISHSIPIQLSVSKR